MLKPANFTLRWLLLLFTLSTHVMAEPLPATAFYYANQLPLELLGTYARVVVEPDNVTAKELNDLKQKGVRVYAYFSIGEVGPERPWLNEIEPQWILGTNPSWKSTVLDMSNPAWRSYLINKRLQSLRDRGFDAFFLDTMDSYQLYAKTPEAQQKQQAGMVELIRSIKQHDPEVHLLFNRGFEILEQVANLCDGVVAESLFKGWDPAHSQYKDVNANDREWLLGMLNKAHQHYHLPVIVLDYLPPNQRDTARDIAGKIKDLGFIPWISTPALDYMGVGLLDLLPRKVLLLYDSQENDLPHSLVHRLIAMPLEYIGYVPEYLDIRSQLPTYTLQGRYAGIISWFNSANIGAEHPFARWMQTQIQDKVKIAFFNVFPFIENTALKQALNLEASTTLLKEPISLKTSAAASSFETPPLPRRLGLVAVKPRGEYTSWLRVNGGEQSFSEPVFTAPWGGMALYPYITVAAETLEENKQEQIVRWIINPFDYIKTALALPDIPVPDNSTENGRRLLTAHIDGDGFYNKSELDNKRFSPELITELFIKPSQLPHTVSIIEAEISPKGFKPELSNALEIIARQIFNLPNVEIASHTYSHPFLWFKAAASQQAESKTALNNLRVDGEKSYTLPIPGYHYSAEREIVGSVKYINEHLTPDHKKTKVFLWSGDALPDEEALALTEHLHIANLNGGTSVTHNGILSLANLSASGIVRGDYFQPYAPIQNENSYTNDWLGPFYGYQSVIDTFKLTENPRRLKPISIYYHFYSGDKLASVEALKRVYSWAQAQTTLPLWISEYTPRLYAFRTAVFEKIPQGWIIHHADNLKTLRLPPNATPPHIKQSQGVVGYKASAQGLYVSLSGQNHVKMLTSPEPDAFPYIDNSNAQITLWEFSQQQLRFRLTGHQPVYLALANFSSHCSLTDQANKVLTGETSNHLQVFNFNDTDTGILYLRCE